MRRFPKHVPELDGLRAFAILPVLLFHSGVLVTMPKSLLARVGAYGWAGVDLFFVLSGFLITGILLDARGSGGYFRNFYVRRALRIWPLYYVVLALIFVLPGMGYFPRPIYPFGYYALYAQNLLGKEFGPTPWAITWSLAVEEQFYLVWPLLVWLCTPKTLRRLLIAMIVVAPVLRSAAFWSGHNQYFISAFPLCRMDTIAVGALLAVWIRGEGFSMGRLKRRSTAMFAAAGSLLLIGPWLPDRFRDPLHVIPQYSLLAVASAGLIGLALVSCAEGSLLTPVLRNRTLRYIGKISYGLYLGHGMVFTFVGSLGIRWAWAILVLEVAVLFVLMSASWRWLESPLLRLKSRFEYGAPAAVEKNALAPVAAYD